MRTDRASDSGISTVIAFIFLLMLIVGIIGIWGVFGLPAQIENARNVHIMDVQNSMIEYKLATDNVRVGNLTGARVNVLLPASTVAVSGSVSFEKDTGTLSIWTNGIEKRSFNVSRLSTTLSGDGGNVIIGYENGGIFREDYGNAAWITPTLLQINNVSDPVIEIVLVNMTGMPDIVSNQYVPLTAVYEGRVDNNNTQPIRWNGSVEIQFKSENPVQRSLWKTMFEEAGRRWGGTDNVSESDDVVSLTLNADPSKNHPILIREVWYNISMAPV
jgi:hypothetical protein